MKVGLLARPQPGGSPWPPLRSISATWGWVQEGTFWGVLVKLTVVCMHG